MKRIQLPLSICEQGQQVCMTKSELIRVLEAPTEAASTKVATVDFWKQFESNHRELIARQREIELQRRYQVKPCRVVLHRLTARTIARYQRPPPARKIPARKTPAQPTLAPRAKEAPARDASVQKMKSDVTRMIKQAEWLHLMIDTLEKAHISPPAKTLCNQINQMMRSNEERVADRFGLQITRNDVRLLSWRQPRWLNDNIINHYLEQIAERSLANPGLPRVYAFNTFFVQRLLESGYDAVRSWTKRLQPDLFSFDLVFIPIHATNHWRLGIIHMKQHLVEHYDSKGSDGEDVLHHFLHYVAAERLDKRKQALNLATWRMTSSVTPKQDNDSDCGVFICTYADLTATNTPIEFTEEDMPGYRQKMMCELMTGQLHVQHANNDSSCTRHKPPKPNLTKA